MPNKPEKSGELMRKKGFLIVGVAFLLFIILNLSVYGVTVGCCVSDTSCAETTTGSCTGTGLIYYPVPCSSVNDCNVGCCCAQSLLTSNIVVATKKHCTGIGGQYYDLHTFTPQTNTYVQGCNAVCGLNSVCTLGQKLFCSDGTTVLAECNEQGKFGVIPGASCPSGAGSLVDSDGDGVSDAQDLCPHERMLTVPEETKETKCSDNIDNDCDGNLDCNDVDCCSSTACASSPTCIVITCGNGKKDLGEECDDGNKLSGDGCNNICKSEFCGDSVVQPGLGEECDDGNTIANDACDNTCKMTGISTPLVAAECNDGIDNDNDGCVDWPGDKGCNAESDYTEDNAPAGCRSCGDGTIDTPNADGFNEDCDSSDLGCGTVGGMQGACNNDCTCLYTCLGGPGMPDNVVAKAAKGEFANEIRWELHPSPSCVPEKTYLYRCSSPAAQCEPKEVIVVNDTASDVFYYHKDNDVAPESRYCYRVDVYYSTGAVMRSDVVCLTTGNMECMAGKNEFCMNNARYKCDDDNFANAPLQDCSALGINPADYTCMGPFLDGTTKCLYQSDCNFCNGLFGLFAITGKVFYKGEPFASEGEYYCKDVPTCYNETTRTTINKYQSCKDITNCYDYRSEDACGENRCNVGECEWVSSRKAFNEFGIGVCRPKNPELYNCSLCGAFKTDAQNKFYGDCDVELCKLYGECYYSYGKCGANEESSCWSYVNEEDCINADLDESTPAKNVSVDVQWDIGFNAKIDGSNKLLQESNDYFGFGLCKWVRYTGLRADIPSYICIKDADNNSVEDCEIGEENKACQIDNVMPKTAFILDSHPMDNGRILLPRKIDLQYYVGEKANVYFCIAKEGDYCYPNETSMCGLEKTFDGASGNYRIYYFAEDYSHNLENVTWLDVKIDADVPVIASSSQKIAGGDGNDYEVLLSANQNDPLKCSGRLAKGNGVPTRSDNTMDFEIDTTFTREYYDLPDDRYYFEYECTDYAGNKAKGREWFSVDTNRIHELMPFGPQKTTTITISATTDSSATCRYARYTGYVPAYESMTMMDTDAERKTHSKTLNLNSNDYYDFIVKCRFGDGIVEGNDNDRIRFSTDLMGPEVIPVTTFEAYDFDVSKTWGKDQLIRLKCVDNYFENVKKVLNMDYGCVNRISYKYNIGDEYQKLELDSDGLSRTELSIIGTGNHFVYYVANDTGNNSEDDYLSININNDLPQMSIDIYPYPMGPGSLPLDSISYGYYAVKVTSTKSLNDINMSLVVSGISMPWSLMYSEDFGKTYYMLMRVPYSEEGGLAAGSVYTGTIAVTGLVRMPGSACSINEIDDTSLIGHKGKIIEINTQDPTIEYKPKIGDFGGLGYPLSKSSGNLYFTNESRLFITGIKKNNAVAEVWFYVLNGDDITVDMADPNKRYSFSSGKNADAAPLNSAPLSIAPSFPQKGMDSLYTTINGNLRIGNYIKITGKERKNYGHYGEYYKIDWLENMGAGIVKVTLDEPLESDLKATDKIDIFEKPYPFNWFGEYIDLETGNNTVYLRPRSASGMMPLPKDGETFYIFTDPNPPLVISQTPRPGTTNNLHTTISIVVREGAKESLVDKDSIKLVLNGQEITTAKNARDFAVNEYTISGFVYYEMIYTPPQPLADGAYTVEFKGHDFAGNGFASSEQASPKWTFTVDTKAPSTPTFIVPNGTFFNGVWYVSSSPGFTLEFSDNDPVNITAIYKDQPYAGFNLGTECEYARNITKNNFYRCLFKPSLMPVQIQSSGQLFVDDTFDIIVEAYKTLAGNQRSPKGEYFLDPLVIDNLTPNVAYLTYPQRVKVDGDVIFRAYISNEFHDLNATINGSVLYQDSIYPLEQISHLGSLYEFKWRTPYYDVSKSADPELDENLTLRIADYASNYVNIPINLTIDLRIPDIQAMHVTVMPTIEQQFGEYLTKYTTVLVTGNFSDDDISEIFIIPGNYIPGQRVYENVSQRADIFNKNFIVEMQINGTINETILNRMNIFLVDQAGYQVFLPLNVVADLEPPSIVTSRVS